MKNKTPYIIKIILAGILAFVFLNIACLFYYNVPNRVGNNEKTTDYKWEENSIYSKGTENIIFFNRINNDGFHNVGDYENNEKINVLVMGSSHAEGFNVNDSETFSEVLKQISGINVYNIGISEEKLENCVQNLENALKRYEPDYVVIETMTPTCRPTDIYNSINGELDRAENFENSPLKLLQDLKYLRLVYMQYQNTQKEVSSIVEYSANTRDSMNAFMNYVNDVCSKFGTKCIILFHPTLTIDNYNQIVINASVDDLSIMEEACTNNDIIFINMEEDFINAYKENYILPHGFNNTVPGVGHLNKYGHEMIANKLAKVIEGKN